MALGLKASVANAMLDSLLKNTAYTGPATVYAQLHTGDPGANGTANVAGNTTRKLVSWGTASGGVNSNSTDLVWTNVSTTETYAEITLFDAVTTGNYLGSGNITANTVTAGDTFTIAAGNLTVTLPVSA